MKRMLYLRERTCFSAQSPPAFQHCEKPTGRCRAGGQADKKKTIRKSTGLPLNYVALRVREREGELGGWSGIYARRSPGSVPLLFLADGCSISRWPPPGTLAKKNPPPPEKVSKAFWNAAPQRSRLQMILEINSALKKKGRHIERRGELFWAAARPRAQRILQRAALLCSTFKTKFTFWTLNFSNGPLRSQAISIQGGIEKYTLPYLGLYEKQKWYADTFR